MRAYLTQIDHHDHEALVAIVPATGDIVGVARFFRSSQDPASAEIALTVADWWQGRGLGSELLRHLVERAREEKITRFTADLLTSNRAMLALIRQLGVVDTTVDGKTIDRHRHQEHFGPWRRDTNLAAGSRVSIPVSI